MNNELSNAYYRDTLKATEALKRMASTKPDQLTQTELDALESLRQAFAQVLPPPTRTIFWYATSEGPGFSKWNQ